MRPIRLPKRFFRLAQSPDPTHNVIMTGVQIVVVWGFALVAVPTVLVRIEDAVGIRRWRWPGRTRVGTGVLAVSSAVGLSAAWVMATLGQGTPVPMAAARKLVVAGPYRYVRNPMAVSAVGQILGVAFLRGSPLVSGLAIGSGVMWNSVMRPSEEDFLVNRFGEEYRRYQRSVRCWIPGRRGFEPMVHADLPSGDD
jgi:protein-S-isoprenylcysteine O-methyltransferase Ste14